MSIDIASYLGTVTRVVETRERDGKPAKVVIASRTYDTSVEDLWNAITTPDRLVRWFMPITGELKLGGRYQLEGNAGGSITACEPPHHLAATWEFGGGVSWIDVTLSKRASGAHLVLEHMAHVDPHWEKFGPGAVGVGWDLTLYGLHLHVTTGFDKGQGFDEMAFFGSPEGKQLVRSANDGWGQAAIAAGEDRTLALESAARTFAFYTGGPPPEAP
ncbi:MAG TPA: SRPBCC family protein [Kofleriaceae bacterium]|nr:SRPBCC family protein [Kofleriaceae bacterium]